MNTEIFYDPDINDCLNSLSRAVEKWLDCFG